MSSVIDALVGICIALFLLLIGSLTATPAHCQEINNTAPPIINFDVDPKYNIFVNGGRVQTFETVHSTMIGPSFTITPTWDISVQSVVSNYDTNIHFGSFQLQFEAVEVTVRHKFW